MDPTAQASTHLLVQYARYHRDQRNIATHFLGVPLIVFALGILLSRPALATAESAWAWALTPAALAWLLTSLWYLRIGLSGLTLAVIVFNGSLVAAASWLFAPPADGWLQWGLSLLGLGWLFQFAGHYYEGRKPAFLDDVRSLLVGPLFLVAHSLFHFGRLSALQRHIEQSVGPTRLRNLAMPV